MHRRYAILDDNQRLLELRIERLGEVLPALVAERMCAALVIGSVAEGRARDDSDIDLVLVLASGTPRRADYSWWESEVVPRLGLERGGRFPIQPVIVGREAVETTEPNLQRAFRTSLRLWDPGGIFNDQPEACP